MKHFVLKKNTITDNQMKWLYGKKNLLMLPSHYPPQEIYRGDETGKCVLQNSWIQRFVLSCKQEKLRMPVIVLSCRKEKLRMPVIVLSCRKEKLRMPVIVLPCR